MFPLRGPFGWDYDSGVRMAIGNILALMKPLRSSHSAGRSLASNMFNSSVTACGTNMVCHVDDRHFITTVSLSGSEFSIKFLAGCRA
jgi:hypothetical protein